MSVPYNAAARLAYGEWLFKYSKEDAGLERYGSFRKRYESIAIINAISKKRAMEDVDIKEPALIELNEYADLDKEEYRDKMRSLEPRRGATCLAGLSSSRPS